MDLLECRNRLDQIDRGMIELFEERMRICGNVAESKLQTGSPVYDGEREREKICAARNQAHGDFNKMAVGELFRQIMTISRRYQYQLLARHSEADSFGFEKKTSLPVDGMRIVYQGVEGAYSHAAVLQYFGAGADAYHVPAFEDTMKAVQNGDADYAVLPIENSSAGAVTVNYDLLVEYQNCIVAETFVQARHALLGLPDAKIGDIRTVYSHPQALMQCSAFLNSRRDWKQISCENTAVAAKRLIEEGDCSKAAVASEIAGELYGLKVLCSGINTNKNNTTRFIILSRQAMFREDAAKLSISFELPHKSGTLYNLLSNFIFNGINLMMIESRPVPGRNWEYRFFVDLEGNLGDAAVKNALQGIGEEASNLRILGNY